jgi:hypothetical protein
MTASFALIAGKVAQLVRMLSSNQDGEPTEKQARWLRNIYRGRR